MFCFAPGTEYRLCGVENHNASCNEMVPEAKLNRQNFHKLHTSPTQTYLDFVREKAVLFQKWCLANSMTDFNQPKGLILVEDCV